MIEPSTSQVDIKYATQIAKVLNHDDGGWGVEYWTKMLFSRAEQVQKDAPIHYIVWGAYATVLTALYGFTLYGYIKNHKYWLAALDVSVWALITAYQNYMFSPLFRKHLKIRSIMKEYRIMKALE